MKHRLSSMFGSRIYIRMAPFPGIGGQFSSLVFTLLAFAALVFSSIYPASLSGARTGFSDMLSPALGALAAPAQNLAEAVRTMSGLAALQAENTRLDDENRRLRDWYQKALLLQSENKSLRDLLRVTVEGRHSYVTGRVLTDAGNTFVKNILVMAGIRDGVQKGQAVISGDGVVGRVIEAGQKTARVLLITDVNSRLPVFIEGAGQHAIMGGQNDALPTLEHLPAGIKLEEGARIVTSGLGGVFPAGLPVGRLARGADGAFRVRLFADFDRLIFVRMINTPDDPNLYSADQGTGLE